MIFTQWLVIGSDVFVLQFKKNFYEKRDQKNLFKAEEI